MTDELLGQLRLLAARDGDLAPTALIGWLRRQIKADVAVVDEHGRLEPSAHGLTAETLAVLRPVLERVSRGQVGAACTRVGELDVLCEGMGHQVPRPVLVIAHPSPLDRDARELASDTGVVLDVLRRLRNADRLADRYRRMAERHRLAVFMTLMAGDPTTARRMTADSVPPLLEAARLRVHLLRCSPRDQAILADALQGDRDQHGPGLVVRCLIYDEHLICLIPDEEPHAAALAATLRDLVRDNPHYALGISRPQPLEATSEAYDQARHALAVADHTRERVATYHGHSPLAGLLPKRQALAWAHAVLRPIGSAPRFTVDVVRLALVFPRAGVARVLGISRNTVSAHLHQVEEALGLDLRTAGARADLALALAIGLPSPDVSPDMPPGEAPTLADLLATAEADAWARTLLKPLLDGANRAVLETLRAWVEADTDAQRTARTLGINRNTVRARVRTAEDLLGLGLLTPGPGTHDLVHALRILGSASCSVAVTD